MCVGLLYIEGFPAMLPINYVHLLPAIYYICSPCAAAILRRRFRNNCFDWILEEFSGWVQPWFLPLTIFFYQPRSWERHCWNALGVVPACIFDVNVVWFDFFFTESVENWKYRASLLTCIECSAVLHILYHQLTKHKSQYSLSLFDSRPLLFPDKINVCFVPSLKICLLSNTIVCLLLVIALVIYSKGHHLLALNWR